MPEQLALTKDELDAAKTLFSTEDKQLALNLMSMVDKAIKKQAIKTGDIGFTEATLTEAKTDTIRHHIKFIKELNVTQNKVDAYKICSWYGFYLSKRLDDPKKKTLLITLRSLNYFLSNERGGTKLSKAFIEHLHVMTKNDCANDEFGVGKNGIYSAFSACKDLVQQQRQTA